MSWIFAPTCDVIVSSPFNMVPVIAIKSSKGSAALEWLPVVVGLLILFVPTFYYLVSSYWDEYDWGHGPIILAVLLWLIWDKRQILLDPPIRTAPIAGLGLLAFGLLLYVLGRSQELMILEIGALAPILAGVLLAMRGWSALRTMWFMLLFVAFLVPPPGMYVNALTWPLKHQVSLFAGRILYEAGYPIAHAGVTISIAQYQLLVADACAGLNSMFSLTALGLLFLYLMRRKSWLHNVLILASVLPIAFIANVIRVIILVLVTYYFGDDAGQGFMHGLSGLVLFVAALVMILSLDTILATFIKARQPAQ